MSAARQLLRTLRVHAEAEGCPARLTVTSERTWLSALFTGIHYEVTVESGAPELGAWLHSLGQQPPSLPGHLLGDVRTEHGTAGAKVVALILDI